MSDSEGDEDLQCYSDATDGYNRSPSTSTTDVRGGGSEKEGCLKEARLITVDGAARMAALKSKKYTKARPWPYLMPFLPDAEADEWLNETVSNLTACILIDDTGPALENHLNFLSRYIGRYGLRFGKELHCKLIRTVYGLIVRPQQHAPIAHSAAAVFVNLITSSRLTRADLILEWRPIFDQYERVILGKEHFIGLAEIQTAVVTATAFFEKGAEREIWKRIRHYISPATMSIAASFVSRCLPTTGYEKDELEMKTGDVIDDHFLPVLWHFYEREEINDYWTDSLVGFFVRLTKDSPSAALPFFHRHLHLIFTRLIRSLGLTAREGKVNVSSEAAARAYQYYGKWIGYMLDTHPSVETHLMRLLSVVESHVHPSRNGTTEMATLLVSHLLVQLTAIIMKRCRRALQAKLRKAEFKKKSIPPISEPTITAYVKALLSILVPALHGGMSSVAGTLLGELAFLRPGLVIPKILDQLYPSLSALCEPERLTNSLAALKRMLILIASDRVERTGYSDVRVPTKKDWLAEREKESDRRTVDEVRRSMRRKRKQQRNPAEKKDSSTEKKPVRVKTVEERSDNTQSDTEAVLSLRPHLVYIAEALIECIDINDTDKAALAYEVFTLLFAVMPIVDCSQTTDKESTGDCTDEEHRLVQLSKRLKDIILRFVDKTFAIIEALATNAPSVAGFESVGGIKDSDAMRKQGSDECVMESCIAHAFGTLFSHTDEEIGKLLCDKVLHFARTSLLDNSTAAGIVTNIVIDCVFENPSCVDNFLEFIVNEIGDVVDEDTQKAEHVDGKAAWLATIAPGFCFLQSQDVHDNFEDLVDMGKRLLACKNKVMYEAGCSCLSSLLLCLLGTTPLDTRADKRYKEGRTPSKLWGVTVDGLRTKHQWAHPVKADIEAAMKILDASLFAEMRRLAKPEGMAREELRKSLSIVYNLFANIVEFAPEPRCDRAPLHHMRQNGLPSAQLYPTRAFQQLAAGEITFEGRNLRVALCELAEGLIACEKCHDSQALECLVGLIPTLDRIGVCQLMTHSPVTMSMLYNSLLRERAMAPGVARDKLISVYNTEPPARDTDASTFECRVMRALFKLSFSLYDTVRFTARTRLSIMLAQFPDTTIRDEFIDGIETALNDERPEITKGALQLLQAFGVAGSMQIQVRARIWPLLLRIRRPEDAKMLKYLDACYDQVKGRYHRHKLLRKPYPPEYLALVDGLLKETPHAGEWTKVGDVDALIATARQKVLERTEKTKKMYAELSATLHTALRASHALSPSERTMDGVRDKSSISALPADFDSAKTAPSRSPKIASPSSVATTAPSCKTAVDVTSPTSSSPSSPIKTASTMDSEKENLIDELKRRPSSATPSEKSPTGAVPTIATTGGGGSSGAAAATIDATGSSVPTSCTAVRPADLSRAIGQLLPGKSGSDTTVAVVAGGAPESATNSSSSSCSSVRSTPVKRIDRSPSRGGARNRQLFPPRHFPLLPPAGSPSHFHLRTSDLCVEMIALVENQSASVETMKEIILPRLLEDRIEQRNSAIDDLLFWLRKNKPKTAREQWACPPKVQGSTGISYGLRPDNIMLVYDSHNLPDTEQKWNTTRFFRKTKGHFAWPPDGKISIPARSAIPVGIQMGAVDAVIVDWFANRDNVHQLFEMTLVHLGETGDEFDTDLLNIVRYLLRNYPDAAATRLLPPLREALERLLAGRHVYEGPSKKASLIGFLGREADTGLKLATQRLSAELFLGIAKGTKYLPFNVLDDLWKWMAPAVIEQLDHQNFQASHFWSTAFDKLLTKEDFRRFWWIIEALVASFDARKTIAPDERWKPANRLSLFILCSWRHSETLNRVLSMAFAQLVPIATSDTMRRAIAALLGDATSVANNRSEFFGGVPERFRLRPLDEYLMELAQKAYKISRQASPALLAAFDPSEDKDNRRARTPAAPVKKDKDEVQEQLKELLSPTQPLPLARASPMPPCSTPGAQGTPSTPSTGGRKKGSGRPGRAPQVEDPTQAKESMYARMLIESVFTFYDVSNRPITDAIFKVLPLLTELAVENEAEDAEIDREHDIHGDAEALVHQMLACIPLDERRAERMAETMEMIIKESSLPTQRATVLKFLHVIVLSNIFLFDRLGATMRSRLHTVVLGAMVDKELPVRREAGNCLCAFLHVGYFELNDALQAHFRTLVVSEGHAARQAGCLGFAAVVRAFPDQFTAKAVPALRELCRLSSGAAKDVLVQHWATNALRDFRASHRDEWSTDAAATIGADLMYLIENELSPPYYV